MPANEAEKEIWNHHVAWSELANKLKRDRARARKAVLFFTILGGAFQTASGLPKSTEVQMTLGVAGFLALALVPVIAKVALKPEQTRMWLRARSISEGIKSEFYTYRAAADPYHEAATALKTLLTKTQSIREWGKDFAHLLAGISIKSEEPPAPLGPDDYVTHRINEQINNFYMPKAQLNARYAQRFRVIEIILTTATALLSAFATWVTTNPSASSLITSPLGPWVAVLTTIGGTIAAFVAEGRYDFQATTYYATAANLKDLVQKWDVVDGKPQPPSPEWSAFVKSSEETISAENRGWMAKLDDSQKKDDQ